MARTSRSLLSRIGSSEDGISQSQEYSIRPPMEAIGIDESRGSCRASERDEADSFVPQCAVQLGPEYPLRIISPLMDAGPDRSHVRHLSNVVSDYSALALDGLGKLHDDRLCQVGRMSALLSFGSELI